MFFANLLSNQRCYDASELHYLGAVSQKNLKITIHTWDIFILLEKHHQCHCKPTNYSYDYI